MEWGIPKGYNYDQDELGKGIGNGYNCVRTAVLVLVIKAYRFFSIFYSNGQTEEKFIIEFMLFCYFSLYSGMLKCNYVYKKVSENIFKYKSIWTLICFEITLECNITENPFP